MSPNGSIARTDPRARDDIKYDLAPSALRDALGTPKKASLLTGRAQRTMRGWFDGSDNVCSRWLEFVATVARAAGANPYALVVASEIVIVQQRLSNMAYEALGTVWRGNATDAVRDAGDVLEVLVRTASRDADDLTDDDLERIADVANKCAHTLAELAGTSQLIRRRRSRREGR